MKVEAQNTAGININYSTLWDSVGFFSSEALASTNVSNVSVFIPGRNLPYSWSYN